jgi:hypothetical protein
MFAPTELCFAGVGFGLFAGFSGPLTSRIRPSVLVRVDTAIYALSVLWSLQLRALWRAGMPDAP